MSRGSTIGSLVRRSSSSIRSSSAAAVTNPNARSRRIGLAKNEADHGELVAIWIPVAGETTGQP